MTFLFAALTDMLALLGYLFGMSRHHYLMPHLICHPDDYRWADIVITAFVLTLLLMLITVIGIGLDPSMNYLAPYWTLSFYIIDTAFTCFMMFMTNYCIRRSEDIGSKFQRHLK